MQALFKKVLPLASDTVFHEGPLDVHNLFIFFLQIIIIFIVQFNHP